MAKRILTNVNEADFQERAESKGFEATKRGWPDFVCFKGGKMYAVEVKPRNRRGEMRLKPCQCRVMLALAAHGIPCFVSDGTVTEKFDPIKHGPRRQRLELSEVVPDNDFVRRRESALKKSWAFGPE